jgi:hypothetical protein
VARNQGPQSPKRWVRPSGSRWVSRYPSIGADSVSVHRRPLACSSPAPCRQPVRCRDCRYPHHHCLRFAWTLWLPSDRLNLPNSFARRDLTPPLQGTSARLTPSASSYVRCVFEAEVSMRRSSRVSRVLLCVLLELGAFSGVPMRPEQIEDLTPKVVQVLPEDDDQGGGPPLRHAKEPRTGGRRRRRRSS